MAIQLSESEGEDSAISQINTTPLVDVMLVLLIIFLITVPAVTTSIKVRLPQEKVEPLQTRPQSVVLSVDSVGHIFWFDTPIRDTAELATRLRRAALQSPQPDIQIRGDMRGSYEGAGRVLYACQQAGLLRVSFITEPPAKAP